MSLQCESNNSLADFTSSLINQCNSQIGVFHPKTLILLICHIILFHIIFSHYPTSKKAFCLCAVCVGRYAVMAESMTRHVMFHLVKSPLMNDESSLYIAHLCVHRLSS